MKDEQDAASARIVAEFHSAIRDEERRARNAGLAFAQACRSGDVDAVLAAADRVNNELRAWPHAFRALTEVVTPDVSGAFLTIWTQDKSIGADFSRRPELLRGLRFLFPPYQGGPVTLYRSEFGRRHRDRRWGVSWTPDLEVAEKFAAEPRTLAPGGSVIVTTVAPSEAIVSELGQHNEEREFIIDPRRLERVEAVRWIATPAQAIVGTLPVPSR